MSVQSGSTLTLRQKRLVRESFVSLSEYSTSLTKLFYGRLFELAPNLRGLFKISLEEQSQKLLDMLTTIVETIDHAEDLHSQLRELGKRHVTYGVKQEHYDVVRTALLWSIGRALESEFDAETKAAWDQLLRFISSAMLEDELP